MGALIRLAVLAWLGFMVFTIVRKFRQRRGLLQGPPAELEMPYCLKCESNRSVVVNRGHEAGDARWFCTRCREGF